MTTRQQPSRFCATTSAQEASMINARPHPGPLLGERAGVRADVFSDIPQSEIQNPKSIRAFTLIEILVVISIIAILSALILATAGYAMSKARRMRVETERTVLETAIQSYKAAKGFYPQDNPNNLAISPLFYELTGTTISLNAPGGTPVSYSSSVSGDNLTVANVTNFFSVGGFVNASPDPTQVQNFLNSTAKSTRTGQFVTNGVNVTVFGVIVPGPVQLRMINASTISPWFYNSTNPTNNPGSYDLWMDVYFSGKTNRISNWSPNPQPI
jgi:prepilin-type N-terminal cleavage/methylation domain-containing protein